MGCSVRENLILEGERVRRTRDGMGTGFTVPMTALFGFLGRDGVTMTTAAALRSYKEFFRAEVVNFGLHRTIII